MRYINIADVHTRLRGLEQVNRATSNRIYIESAQIVKNSNKVSNIKRFIEESVKMNHDIPMYLYIELFESVIENGTINDIQNIGNYITENVILKTRNSKATQTLIRHRLGRLTGKLQSKVSDSLDKLKNTINTNTQKTKEQAANEAYMSMLDKATIVVHCDRVLENYNNISKRFNLDRLFIENTRINGVGDTVVDLCNKIDTYNMPNSVKFNTVIETAWYGFESNFIKYSKSEILETAVDYFMFKPDGLNSCKEILEATLFYDKDDKYNLDIFTEEEPEDENKETVNEAIMNNYIHNSAYEAVSENTSFSDLFNKFKQEELPKDDKPERKIKTLINKLYSRNVESIIEETPDLLQWIRRFFIVGSCAVPVIGPVLMAVSFIVDKFITLHYDREEVPKMIKCFSNEIKASKTKLKSTEDNEEKEKLKKYIKTLEDAKDKLDSFYNDLLTDKEQEERYDEIDDDFDLSDYESDDNNDSDLLGDDEFDDFDDFLESSIFGKLDRYISEFINIGSSNNINETSMYHLIKNISDDDLINIAEICSRYPDIFYRNSVAEAIQDNMACVRTNRITFNTIMEKSLRLNSLNNAACIINKRFEQSSSDMVVEATYKMEAITEAYSAISIMIETYNNPHYMLEASFTNTLKVASMKLKNAFTKMSDKEKGISRSIDIGLNNFKKSIERALTNDNRESIIKGSILPSASKLIKLCIVNIGFIALHQPLLAIISTLGYLGTSAKFKAKERQMLIDEIEIELEMCEKYINIAEQKNDMKALKQLLTTKKELERQRQRIKYKLKVDFGQKYYDSKAAGSGNK